MIEKFINISNILQSKKYSNSIIVLILIVMVLFITVLIFMSGGTTAFVHLMYIPIILSVFIFNIKTGIIFSIISGLILGPYMPLVVSQGIRQETISWIFRIVMFMIISIITGVSFQYVKTIHNLEKKKFYNDIITGFPNANKFSEDVTILINEKKLKSISFVIFEFKNREMIDQYVNYEIGCKTHVKLLEMTDEFFKLYQLYSIDTKKFVIVIPGSNCIEAYSMTDVFLKKVRKPIYIEELPVSVVIKAGIVSYPQHSRDLNDIILKLGKSMNIALTSQNNIIIYDDVFHSQRTKYYNTLVSIFHSLRNNTFTINYQPKINISENRIMGVEALLRIQDNACQDISVQRLITIAEEVGFINEITRWVIKKVVNQMKIWKDEGIEVNVSVNLSPQDFNESICEFVLKYLDFYDIEPSVLEFELTERSIIEDEVKVLKELSLLQSSGIKLSLDDYGTGYNSLNYLVNSSFNFDYIKIDKAFISEITEEKNKLLIRGIIDTAHAQGIEVIAEGVETQEQLDALIEINCDHAQGYLFSKAKSPEELVEMIMDGNVSSSKP